MKTPSAAAPLDDAIDPLILETVERALTPYARSYPPEVVEQLRSEALLLLTSHPVASALAEQLRPARTLHAQSFADPHNGGALDDHLRRERQQRALIRAASLAGRAFLTDEIDPIDVLTEPEAHRHRLDSLAGRLLSSMIAGMAETAPSAEDTIIDRQTRRLARETVEHALARVGEGERALYKERYIEGRPIHELASKLGVSLATVRRQHERFLDENARALHNRGVTELPPPSDD